MTTRTQVATILQKTLGREEGLLVLEYIEERVPPERRPELVEGVARQRDVAEVQIEIEKARVHGEMEQADPSHTLENAALGLSRDIEQLGIDLGKCLERAHAVHMRWAFFFWISEMAVLGGLLLAVLRSLGQL